MKKKPLTYLLIAAVIAVWAIIIQKVVVSVQDEALTVQNSNKGITGEGEEKWYMKSYSEDPVLMEEIDHDPFRGIPSEPEIKSAPTETVNIPVQPVYKPQVMWPSIVFQGFSSKRNQKTGKYAILNINNQPFMLAEGETALDVKLQKNWGDSLALSFQDQNKKFYLHTQ
jgi:hypothetical protein